MVDRRPALFARQAVAAFDFGQSHELEAYDNGWKVRFTAQSKLTAVLNGGSERHYPVLAGDELVSVGDDVYLKLAPSREPDVEPDRPDPGRGKREPRRPQRPDDGEERVTDKGDAHDKERERTPEQTRPRRTKEARS